MEKISPDAYRILLISSTDPVIISDENREICRYLLNLKYVRQKRIMKYGSPHKNDDFAIEITESGKAYLESFKEDSKRYKTRLRFDLIALGISGLSLLVSAIALFTSLH